MGNFISDVLILKLKLWHLGWEEEEEGKDNKLYMTHIKRLIFEITKFSFDIILTLKSELWHLEEGMAVFIKHIMSIEIQDI